MEKTKDLGLLAMARKNLRASAEALGTLDAQFSDREPLDSLECCLVEIAQAAEQVGFVNLSTFADDLHGMTGLLRDRIARVEGSIAFLAQGLSVLKTMTEISAAGLDHAQRGSGELLAHLADSVSGP